MFILGIDEAGRGPVLGPMVLTGIVIAEKDIPLLREYGVTDSKQFTGKKAEAHRNEIAKKLESRFPFVTQIISSQEIDENAKQKKTLNQLEQSVAVQIMQHLQWDKAILDGATLFKPLCSEKVQAYNKADQTCMAVAAASIIAKNTRDQYMTNLFLHEEIQAYGEVRGKGYANVATEDFLNWYVKQYKRLPSFYRKSFQWKNF